ncbi:MAG: 4-hydroxy-tetrahydrodipicolinate reductase [Chloroflexi bacterium RBG_13_54_9]|nr:MAG: 4-hydroxy-tetrahydrodipicolinate reductase [Chloroflexi bacterium RBG_13_54_9]
MEQIRVVVHGARGKMGQEVLATLCRDPELEPVGAVEKQATDDNLALPDGSGLIPFSSDLESILVRCHPQVLVDFTVAEATMPAVRLAVQHGVRPVVGTTGLSADDLAEMERLCRERELGGVVAANFSLGAVLMIHLAKVAARYFDYAEVIELHHEQKIDAPSGTAITTAREMVAARGKPFMYVLTQKESLAGTRGGQIEGVALHSVRLPGLLAHQEVIFGALGQTLTIRHDSISRESFMPGVVLAVKEVVKLNQLVFGLDTLLGL